MPRVLCWSVPSRANPGVLTPAPPWPYLVAGLAPYELCSGVLTAAQLSVGLLLPLLACAWRGEEPGVGEPAYQGSQKEQVGLLALSCARVVGADVSRVELVLSG